MQMPSLLKKSTRNLKTLVSVPSTPLKASQRQREIEKQKKLAEKWIMKGAEGKTNIIEDLKDDGTIKVLNADHCLPLSDIQERQLREISLKDFHIPIGKELEEIEKRKRQDRIRYEEVRSKINLLYEKFDKADLEVAKAQLRLEEAQIKLLEYENQFIKEQKQQISQLNGIIETNNKKQIEKLQGSFSLLSPSLLLVFSPLLSFSYLPFSPSHISPSLLLISPLLSFSYLPFSPSHISPSLLLISPLLSFSYLPFSPSHISLPSFPSFPSGLLSSPSPLLPFFLHYFLLFSSSFVFPLLPFYFSFPILHPILPSLSSPLLASYIALSFFSSSLLHGSLVIMLFLVFIYPEELGFLHPYSFFHPLSPYSLIISHLRLLSPSPLFFFFFFFFLSMKVE